MTRKRIYLFLIWLLFLFNQTAFAQTTILTDIEENYSGKVAVSGSIIVGAAFGDAILKANPSKLIVITPSEQVGGRVCLSTKTRDGQYWSQASVDLPFEIQDGIHIEPKNGWKYLKELKAYNRSDFAALARLGHDCQYDPKSTILPVKYLADNQGPLQISINSQRAIRVSAELQSSDDTAVKGDCVKAASVGIRSTAFNYLCSFDTATLETKGIKTLIVNRRLRVGGKRSDDVKIYIP